MLIDMLKSKIHRATITFCELDYEGSLTIDEKLMKEAGIVEYEKVQIVNINNGARFETYAIKGKDREMGLNGAAARLGQIGDKIIVFTFTHLTEEEAKTHKPKKVYVDKNNKILNKL